MRIAAPVASSFVTYIFGLVTSVFILKKAKQRWQESRYWLAGALILVGLVVGAWLMTMTDRSSYAYYAAEPQLSNSPMGVAKGIYPGRVAWVHDPDATNENCTNQYGDGWFLDKNNDQQVIDQMVSQAVQVLTGTASDMDAWNAIFKYYNMNHGKGSVSYTVGEKILIKTNATSSWSGNFDANDLSIVSNQWYGIAETSPHVVLAVLRQLVHFVGVDEGDIYVGDPLKHIYKHCYDLWHSEFPGVNYLDHDYGASKGRIKVVASANPLIFYSDRGATLRTGSRSSSNVGDPVTNDHLYAIFQDVDYMINIPALKAHARAGITLFAKNHFGSHSRDNARHLHGGLVNPDENNPETYRFGMGLYRVQVDIMGHEILGRKNLFYLLDGLWAGSEAVDPPNKWSMRPFNNDWTSSIFASQDPVAIESVAFDFLKEEYFLGNPYGSYPQMDGVDDYLHQAADPGSWPPSIQYDPENDGTVLTSLGVHEHWSNATDKQYSRNLETGNGIELVYSRMMAKNFTVSTGWNIVSVPVLASDMSRGNLFPSAATSAYGFDNGYVASNILENGKGYWLKFDTTQNLQISGSRAASNTIPVESGWNLIGPFDENTPVSGITSSPSGIISSSFFGYNNGYTMATALEYGEGYWVKVDLAGFLNTTSSGEIAKEEVLSEQPSSDPESDWGRIMISDADKNTATLYLTKEDVDLSRHELPPTPPSGVFDVRFDSNRYLEVIGLNEKYIRISSAHYPIRIKAEGIDLSIRDALSGNLVNKKLWSGKEITIKDQNINLIVVSTLASIEIPMEYQLFQNYPNPFNPTTTIRFSLPEAVNVNVSVYSLLGEEVEVLLNKELEAGFHQVELNALEYPSGIYFYGIEAGYYSDLKKMILLK
jgi:hypothetical protein